VLQQPSGRRTQLAVVDGLLKKRDRFVEPAR
jgi:hypothetical protein